MSTSRDARREVRRETRAERRRAAAAQQRMRRPWWLVGLAASIVVLAALAWVALGPKGTATSGPGGLPGPLGGPNVAQDVNSLVGKPAPAFTLADSEGTARTVTPGQGRPLVLVSHMGIT